MCQGHMFNLSFPPQYAAGRKVLLTLEGVGVTVNDVLQLIAVRVNVVKGFTFYGQLVALLHLPGAAGWALVLAHQQIHIWGKGEKTEKT